MNMSIYTASPITQILEGHSEVADRMREDHQEKHVVGKIQQTVFAYFIEYRVGSQIANHLKFREGIHRSEYSEYSICI